MKDLPDLALLASLGPIDGGELRASIETLFAHRQTHSLPPTVPPAPEAWTPIYARMADQNDLDWPTLPDLADAVSRFLDPVLAGTARTWDADSWTWTRS